MAPATCGMAVWLVRNPTPRSSSHCITPQIVSRPKALPPDRTTPSSAGTRWRGSRNSRPWMPTAQPRISTPPIAGRWGRSTVTPVSPTGSLTWPTERPEITGRLAAQPGASRRPRAGRPRAVRDFRSARSRARRAAHVGELDATERHLRRDLDASLRERANDRNAGGRTPLVDERYRSRAGQRRRVAARGAKDERHLLEATAPAPSRIGGEEARDHAVDDGRLALGLDLIRDDEPALASLEQCKAVLLDEARLHEPAPQLWQLGQLGRALEQRGVGRRQFRGAARRGRRRREQPAPSREAGGGIGAETSVQRERLHDEPARVGRIRLHPGQLLMLAQRGLLPLEAAPGDRAPRHFENAGLVVQQERAEQEAAPEPALEENPHGSRSAAVDARQPAPHGALGSSGDERRGRRRHERREAHP